MIDVMIAQLDYADLQPALWRTARRIIDRINVANNYCRLSYDELTAIVQTDSDATARAHLARLAAAGLITYRRNSAVHIYWHADAPTEPPADPEPETRALSIESRANCSESRAPEPPADPDPEPETRALSIESRANCSESRALSSGSRAASLTTTTGKQAGLDPASLPGRGAGKPQPPTPSEPLTDEQQASVAMLTDAEIGLDLAAAERIARRYATGLVRAHCCRYLRDAKAGKVDGPAVIGHRLAKSYGASVLPADHRTAFWRRHGERPQWPQPQWQDDPADDGADDPAEPALPPKPQPQPGTPAAFWAQLQADFALHQPAGSVDSVLQDSWVIDYADGAFTIGIADAARIAWVEKKLRNQVKRRLAVIMGLATVDVTFRAEAPPAND